MSLSLTRTVNGIKTRIAKLTYLGKRNLLYDVRMKGNKRDTDKAVKKFGEYVVIPELNICLERRIDDFENNYNADVMEMKNWQREPRKIEGQDNTLYARKDIQANNFNERSKKQKTGQLLFESLYGILNTEGYEAFSKAKKYNQGIINELPLGP